MSLNFWSKNFEDHNLDIIGFNSRENHKRFQMVTHDRSLVHNKPEYSMYHHINIIYNGWRVMYLLPVSAWVSLENYWRITEYGERNFEYLDQNFTTIPCMLLHIAVTSFLGWIAKSYGNGDSCKICFSYKANNYPCSLKIYKYISQQSKLSSKPSWKICFWKVLH